MSAAKRRKGAFNSLWDFHLSICMRGFCPYLVQLVQPYVILNGTEQGMELVWLDNQLLHVQSS